MHSFSTLITWFIAFLQFSEVIFENSFIISFTTLLEFFGEVLFIFTCFLSGPIIVQSGSKHSGKGVILTHYDHFSWPFRRRCSLAIIFVFRTSISWAFMLFKRQIFNQKCFDVFLNDMMHYLRQLHYLDVVLENVE